MAGIAAGVGSVLASCSTGNPPGHLKEANQQIVQYSESLASQAAELTKAQSDAKATESADEVSQLTSEQTKTKSYQALLRHMRLISRRAFDDGTAWNCRMCSRMSFPTHRKQSIIQSVRL